MSAISREELAKFEDDQEPDLSDLRALIVRHADVAAELESAISDSRLEPDKAPVTRLEFLRCVELLFQLSSGRFPRAG